MCVDVAQVACEKLLDLLQHAGQELLVLQGVQMGRRDNRAESDLGQKA